MHMMLLAVLATLCSGCDTRPGADQGDRANPVICRIAEAGVPMHPDVRETSGIAISSHDPGVLWTHNDRGNEPVLFAIDAEGSRRAVAAVAGARLIDWEDMAKGVCAAGTCLYIADIGDNSRSRETITIYELPEPAPDAVMTQPARALHARYPDGPHNAEALFMMPDGDLYIVTKGDDGPVSLYRYPSASGAEPLVTLQKVRDLALPRGDRELVTAAATSEDGSWVAIRTYNTLHFFPAPALVGGADAAPLSFDLRPLGEPQGEGLALGGDGTVWLTSESVGRAPPLRTRLVCTLPTAGA